MKEELLHQPIMRRWPPHPQPTRLASPLWGEGRSADFGVAQLKLHPNYQNQGVGAKAIELVERKYSDAAVWILSTPELDFRNRHLYEKIGYKETGKQRINDELVLIEYRKEIRNLK